MQTLKNKLTQIFVVAILSASFMANFLFVAPVSAQASTDNCETDAKPAQIKRDENGKVVSRTPAKTASEAQIKRCLENNPIVKFLNRVIGILSAVVGIAIVGGIIWGGIQYIWAGDNSSDIKEAKERILNALIALLVFIFLYAFLEWLIPGKSGIGLLDL